MTSHPAGGPGARKSCRDRVRFCGCGACCWARRARPAISASRPTTTGSGMPGLKALNKGGSSEVSSLSCPTPGHCTAAGTYTDRSGHRHGFVTQPR
jgi:hypothetical protein